MQHILDVVIGVSILVAAGALSVLFNYSITRYIQHCKEASNI